MSGIIWHVIIGFSAGLLARALKPGDSAGFVAAVAGAVLLLAIYGFVKAKSADTDKG